jgi:hypothetical protein
MTFVDPMLVRGSLEVRRTAQPLASRPGRTTTDRRANGGWGAVAVEVFERHGRAAAAMTR